MIRILTDEQKTYNAQSLLCDQFWEFHRALFDELTSEELADVLQYYPQDFSSIPDVFDYRQKQLGQDPMLADRAQKALQTILASVGVTLPGLAEK